MAEIWVPRKCVICGETIKAGERAILTAEVKTSGNETHGGTTGKKRQLRVNFFANSKRELRHLTCGEESKCTNIK